MTDIEQPMIRIRLYREGGRDTWNRPIIKKEKKKGKKEYKKEKKEKGKEKTHVQ
jgi:hypothetical protein